MTIARSSLLFATRTALPRACLATFAAVPERRRTDRDTSGHEGVDTIVTPCWTAAIQRGYVDKWKTAACESAIARRMQPDFTTGCYGCGGNGRFRGEHRRRLRGQPGEEVPGLHEAPGIRSCAEDHHGDLMAVFR